MLFNSIHFTSKRVIRYLEKILGILQDKTLTLHNILIIQNNSTVSQRGGRRKTTATGFNSRTFPSAHFLSHSFFVCLFVCFC
uniref:Uncharacterized protein n=1 Tax=Anguilla anguilla TaxID=7936 RepID=A0A0E9X529_ANGAN